jgi:hypothetical protein
MKIRKQTLDSLLIELEKISGYGMTKKKRPHTSRYMQVAVQTYKPNSSPVKIVDDTSIQKVLDKNPSLVGTKPSVVKISDNKFSVGDVTFDTFDSAKSVSDFLKNQ